MTAADVLRRKWNCQKRLTDLTAPLYYQLALLCPLITSKTRQDARIFVLEAGPGAGCRVGADRLSSIRSTDAQ